MSNTISSVTTAKAQVEKQESEATATKKLPAEDVSKAIQELKSYAEESGIKGISGLLAQLVDMISSFSKSKLPKLKKSKAEKKAEKAAKKEAKKQAEEAAKQQADAAATPPATLQSSAVQTAPAQASAEPSGTVIKEDGIYTSLNAVKNPDGTHSIYTEDGYIVSTENKDQAWTIKGPDGRVTRIWGDPHVTESDGDNWDFKDQSSFIFGNNKVTIETAPAGNGQTYTSKITVYNGDSRATISGIDSNKSALDILKQDALLDDGIRDDGDLFVLTKETGGDDKFVLIKDVGEKFDTKFEKKVGVGEKLVFDKLLTEEQKRLLGRI